MAKVDLEKVLDLMINESSDQANVLLKKWFAQQTRQIHESILNEDDHEESIEDDQKNTQGEEYFGEEDVEGGEQEQPEGEEQDAPVKSDVTQVSTDPKVINDQFADLQADLARLQKEFEEIHSGASSEEDDENVDKVPAQDGQQDNGVKESVELQNVKADGTVDGLEVGSKTPIKGNRKSALPAKNNRDGAKPVETKNPASKGYAREKAPEVKDAKVGRNARKKWSDDTSKVSREGNSKAELNKNYSKENDKSVLGNRSK